MGLGGVQVGRHDLRLRASRGRLRPTASLGRREPCGPSVSTLGPHGLD